MLPGFVSPKETFFCTVCNFFMADDLGERVGSTDVCMDFGYYIAIDRSFEYFLKLYRINYISSCVLNYKQPL
jgi:hypothetical protein